MKKILLVLSFISLFSLSALAQSSNDETNLAFEQDLQQQAHVVCSVIKQKIRGGATLHQIELNVQDGKADVELTYVGLDQRQSVQKFSQRAWIVTEAYDDYSMETQYEALVDLTDDSQNFVLIQFYANHSEAHGVFETPTNSYDLLCR
jgi:hypothetical protein